MGKEVNEQQMSRRRFLRTMAFGSAAVAAGVLAACGGAAPAAESPAEAPATTELAKIKAMMWSNSPVLDENFKKRAEMFNAKHAGKYEVSMELLPWDQYWPKVDLAYASKEPIDVYFWDVQAYGHYKQGLLKNVQADLDAVADFANPDLYPQEQMAVWKFDGANMYAIPENFQSMALFYNKKIFDEAGLAYPDENTTWDDVIVMAEKLKKTEGDEVVQWGFDVGDLAVWWGSISLAWAQGGGYFDKVVEPTKFTFGSPAAQNALKWIQDVMYVSKLAPNSEMRSVVGQEMGIFGSGIVAMYPGGTWMISSNQELPFEWDMAPMPKWGNNRAMPYWFGGWVIPKDGKHTDAATAWAIWCATEYQQTMAETRDWIPIRADARNSEAFLSGMPAGFASVSAAISSAQIGDVYSAKVQQILGEVISPTLDLVWNNKISPADAGKEIDDKANAMLSEG
jgi:multiple sugar transport system substrate-binding protein